jgi:hypothetical protein
MLQSLLAHTLRLASVLAVLINLVLAAFGARGLPVAAQETGPSARIQIVVGNVDILDDRDGGLAGAGEVHFHTSLYKCLGAAPCLDRITRNELWDTTGVAQHVIDDPIKFSADSGETKTLNLVYPQTSASVSHGLDLFPTDHYVLRFYVEEWDDASDDEFMGEVVQEIDLAEHGLGIGQHEQRAVNADSNHTGDFIIHYEIRQTPLPDLRIDGIKVQDQPASDAKQVCLDVINAAAYPSSAFSVALLADDKFVTNGAASVNGLGGGKRESVCLNVVLPATGQVTLTATVDPQHQADEYNEANNVYKQAYSAPKTNDLSVTAITVSGQDSNTKEEKSDCKETKDSKNVKDGKNSCQDSENTPKNSKSEDKDAKSDCADGKNTVTVAVKNGGTGSTQKFAVQLAMDGAVISSQDVAPMGSGEARDVMFQDILLKKGKHQLVATADANATVAETDEQNNALTIMVRCGKDD